jgi:hypothetical protein
MNTIEEWYDLYGHGHCPFDCDHPQPFIKDGKVLCGKCYFMSNIETEMVPCTPEIC